MHYSKLSKIDTIIHLEGKSGTGKTYLAKKIVKNATTFAQIIHVNMAAFNEGLFESELFGYKKGAFTGAMMDKIGFCDKAQNKTLFLDEIAELSLGHQAKLLTFLEDRIYYPVGSTEPKKFVGRIITATNKDIYQMVKEGDFREDLMYRLRTFSYKMKPLHERDDKKEIILSFIQRKNLDNGSNQRLSDDLLSFLFQYQWPGNIRELLNCLDYLFFHNEEVLAVDHLPDWVRYLESQKEPVAKIETLDFTHALENFEKLFLEHALKENKGKINQTTRNTGMSKVTLISKIKKYDIKVKQFKQVMVAHDF